MILNRDTILQADDLAREQVDVPEWGGQVYVRMMTGEERDRWEMSISKRRSNNGDIDLNGIRAALAVIVVCDEKGNSVFKPEDAKALAKKNGTAIERICFAARKLSRLDDADIEDSKKN